MSNLKIQTLLFSILILVLLCSSSFTNDLHSGGLISQQKSEVSAQKSFDVNNIRTALSNLVNSTFIFKALLIYWLHLLFQTVGWYLSSLVWNSGRSGAVDLDPDFSGAITDGLLNPDFAATNLALGAGQFVFYFLVWSTVVSSGGSRSDAESGVGRTDLDLSQPQLGAALDNLFAPATITKQFVINFLGAAGGTLFLFLVSLLPETSYKRRRRDANTDDDDDDDELTERIIHHYQKWD